MDELHTILANHHPQKKKKNTSAGVAMHMPTASTSEIPDLFFDEILVKFKLTRIEVLVLMHLYRQVWCRANLYKTYGFSPVLSHNAISQTLELSIDEIYNALRRLESYGFIETIRSGQYFVRKYFTKENDYKFGQSYDDF